MDKRIYLLIFENYSYSIDVLMVSCDLMQIKNCMENINIGLDFGDYYLSIWENGKEKEKYLNYDIVDFINEKMVNNG